MAKSKKPKTPTPAPQHTPEELAILERHPTARIVPGSWLAGGDYPPLGKKPSVLISCLDCEEVTRRATSDVFQAKRCPGCSKVAKLAKRRKVKPA